MARTLRAVEIQARTDFHLPSEERTIRQAARNYSAKEQSHYFVTTLDEYGRVLYKALVEPFVRAGEAMMRIQQENARCAWEALPAKQKLRWRIERRLPKQVRVYGHLRTKIPKRA